jgi:hypothetical protein
MYRIGIQEMHMNTVRMVVALRGRFNVEEDGAVVLRLLDERGTIRVKLGAEESGSGLLLANQATEPGIHLLATAKGSSIRVANQDGRQQLIAP